MGIILRAMTDLIDGPRRAPLQGPARQLVVFLHGYGADGNDLIGIADLWRDQLPHAAFASPHGPQAFPFGPMGRQWFPIRTSERTPEQVVEDLRLGVPSAKAAVDAFLDAELARLGLEDQAVALVGFSQGGAVGLYAGLARPVRAIVSFSGALREVPDSVRSPAPQVFLAHGEADPVVPVAASVNAAKALAAKGVPVRSRIVRGLGHGIDGESANEAVRFLRDAFAAAS